MRLLIDEKLFYMGQQTIASQITAQNIVKDPRFLMDNAFQAPILARSGTDPVTPSPDATAANRFGATRAGHSMVGELHGELEANVYIGIGTLVLILLIILIVMALRGRTV